MVVIPVITLLIIYISAAKSLEYDDYSQEIVKIISKTTTHQTNKEYLHFSAFGKKYTAVVHQVKPPIHENFRAIDGKSKEFNVGLDTTLSGHLQGYKANRVYLIRTSSGAYLGFVKDGDEMLHLEPANLHFPNTDKQDTMVYKDAFITTRLNISAQMLSPITPPQTKSFREKREHPFADYLRSQRGVASLVNEKKNRCSLKIVADHRFFHVVGKGDKATTARYIMNTIAKVNEIFQAVNWDEDMEGKVENRGRFYNFGFSIKELKIWDKPSPELGHYNGDDVTGNGTWSSNRLLQSFNQRESSPNFCIVHLMTAQSFSDSASLGLAYVATGENGGICSDTQQFGDRLGSYNTLFTSVIGNTGKKDYPLVTREAEIVVAHEYGHSWGAVHDDERLHEVTGINKTCVPDFRNGGKYIMNPFAQAGFDTNNNVFSPCSVHMIREMLKRRWTKCFEIEQNSLCGNGVVEDGEQCDEGALLPSSDGDTRCCSRNCTFLPMAQCSPLNSPCCTSKCSYHTSSHMCLPPDTWQCKANSYCSGISAECPPPKPVKDGTVCVDEGECKNGDCIPFCERFGKKSCICEEMNLSCRRCCRGNNGTGPCIPEFKAADLPDGSWCVQGYCKNSKCITESADYLTYYLQAFQDGSVFWKIIQSNIVTLVVALSVPVWCLVGYCTNKHDNRQRAIQDREMECQTTTYYQLDVVHVQEPSRIATDFF